ncbi:MAG: RluA family pseudouridine synthase [Candidatus Marinarcus sp.]|uniref:RluA family pseudouridine synthase n=1 Tax=Candidatus Marinarcus sp. TaxID=3100987 RepID=UPI003B009CE4
MFKKYDAIKGRKIQILLLRDLKLSPKFAQRMLGRFRVFDSNYVPYTSSQIVEEDFIYIAEFEGHTRGLKPLLVFKDFALFDKPSNLMVHPSSKHTSYSLLDEIRYHLGEKANQIHRIDAETSGLLLVGLHKESINALGTMFEAKEYQKSYLAIVEGHIKNEIRIDSKIDREGKVIGVRMKAGDTGKNSLTHIKPLSYNPQRDITLIQANPITGRQHQIRVHLYSIGHKILGDPIYGVDDDTAEAYLNKTLSETERVEVTKSHRLWLHAHYLAFNYKGIIYKIYSKNSDIFQEFNA